MKKEKFITGDIWLSAAIACLLKIFPEFITKGGRTLFVFPSNDDIYRAISHFNNGAAFNLWEYSLMVKRLKMEMITRKQKHADAGSAER